MINLLKSYLPILQWAPKYKKDTLINDLIVGVVVTMMLIPQSLAYAQLAGLPPEVGLYASIAPLILYAIFGTSRVLAVGPVAIASLMTAAAASQIASQGTPEYLGAAIALAIISGLMLIVMGILKLGFLANFLSHPVVAGFITASGVQIAAGQLSPVLGIHSEGETLLDIIISLSQNIAHISLSTALIGIGSLIFLFLIKTQLKKLLISFGISEKISDLIAKAGPVAALILTTVIVWGFGLSESGVKIVGEIPKGLPSVSIPPLIRHSG